MGKVTISNYKPLIGANPSFGYGYYATYQPTCAVQNDFEEEVKNIRWFWPYKLSQEAMFIQKLLFIIPIEYRFATNAELVGIYPSLAGWNEFFTEKVIFYEEYFSDGTRKTGCTKPYAFFSKYKLEEEK